MRAFRSGWRKQIIDVIAAPHILMLVIRLGPGVLGVGIN